jgi:alpha-ketoglutarate-dependent taurine dioxygenase
MSVHLSATSDLAALSARQSLPLRHTLAEGIVEVRADPTWVEDVDAVLGVLDGEFGAGVTGAALPPPAYCRRLRSRLIAAAPRLTTLVSGLRGHFAAGECVVIVPRLGLGEQTVDVRRKLLYALAVALGDVTPTEPRNSQVVWDVRPRAVGAGHFPTFSEHDREAEYHTDSQFSPDPERYFLLYVVRQARCGGGLSMLRNGRRLHARLSATQEGREALQTLSSTPLAARIPPAFSVGGYDGSAEYNHAPVFADKPLWRWRRDTIKSGLAAHPEQDTPQVRRALETVATLLGQADDEVLTPLPDDALCVVDNHVALHGRTAFTDPQRHVLRIRFHEPR